LAEVYVGDYYASGFPRFADYAEFAARNFQKPLKPYSVLSGAAMTRILFAGISASSAIMP